MTPRKNHEVRAYYETAHGTSMKVLAKRESVAGVLLLLRTMPVHGNLASSYIARATSSIDVGTGPSPGPKLAGRISLWVLRCKGGNSRMRFSAASRLSIDRGMREPAPLVLPLRQ